MTGNVTSMGKIKDRLEEHSDILVTFVIWVHQNGLLSYIKKDECWVPFQHLIFLICAPTVQQY